MLHFWTESQNAGTASQNYGTEKGTHIWEFFWKFLSCTSGCQFLVHFWTKLIRKLHNKQLGQNDEFWFLNKMAILQILPFSKIGRISLSSIDKVGRCYIQMFRWRTLFLVTGTTEIFSWAIGNTVFSWKLFFSDQVIYTLQNWCLLRGWWEVAWPSQEARLRHRIITTSRNWCGGS